MKGSVTSLLGWPMTCCPNFANFTFGFLIHYSLVYFPQECNVVQTWTTLIEFEAESVIRLPALKHRSHREIPGQTRARQAIEASSDA